jgi:hypothetical protein
MSRAPDERFTSLLEMQDFKRRLRDNSRSQVISSRGITVRSVEDDARALQVMGYGNGLPAAGPTHWSFGQLCRDRIIHEAGPEVRRLSAGGHRHILILRNHGLLIVGTRV